MNEKTLQLKYIIFSCSFQYFYVAEICTNLNPKSSFPGDDYSTFEEYYLKKYDIQIQNLDQPLLDVDHTSARLNFLTPRQISCKIYDYISNCFYNYIYNCFIYNL